MTKTPDLDEFANWESERADLRSTVTRLQRQLTRAKGKVDDLVEATIDAATDAARAHGMVKKATPAPTKDRRSKATPEAALWHMTDWQGSKVTPSYNSQVMHERVRRFCDKAEKITEIQRADHPVRHCVIAFGGDMVEGLFNYPTQPYEIDATLFEQWVMVSDLEAEVVRRALSIYDTVEVIGEWGNHGRIGSKRDAVVRSDNVDRMTYEFARRLLAHEKRLTWADSAEDVQRIEIGNYRAVLLHGDEVGRNGFASQTTIVGHITKWQSGSFRVDGKPWGFRDAYVGHYHNAYEQALPNGEGAVYGTGSTESDNRYAGVHMAATATPSQRLHFIDPAKGIVTAQYKVLLGDG